jgi:hypothetical protein
VLEVEGVKTCYGESQVLFGMIEKGRVVWTGDSAALRVAADVQLRHLGVARGGGTP